MNIHRLVLAAGLAAAVSQAGAATITLEKVISNNDPVPGVPGAQWLGGSSFFPYEAFGRFSAGIDQNGGVIFKGQLEEGIGGVTSTDKEVVCYGQPVGAPGAVALVARQSGQAPGMPVGVNIIAFQTSPFPIASNGTLWFGGNTSSAAQYNYIATGTPFALSKAAAKGDTILGDTLSYGPAASSPNIFAVNGSGQIAFAYSTDGFTVFDPNGQERSGGGVFVGSSNATMQRVYRLGTSYPELPAGAYFYSMAICPLHNGSGDVVAEGQMAGTGITLSNNDVMLMRKWNASAFTVMAREADPAPGCGGATYVSRAIGGAGVEDPTFAHYLGNFNNSGQGVFSAGLQGTGVVTANNHAIFKYDQNGAVSLFLRKGDAVAAIPGATHTMTSGNQIPSAEAARVQLNNSGVAVYRATLAGTGVTVANNTALIRTSLNGTVPEVVIGRKGDQVPGVVGALYSEFTTISLNNGGKVLFTAFLSDDPTEFDHDVFPNYNDRALLAWDPATGVQKVVQLADDLTSLGFPMVLNYFGAQDSRQTSNVEGGSSMLTDNNRFVFTANGAPTDGTILRSVVIRGSLGGANPCYANCDASTAAPVLNVGDFTCFLQKFAAADSYANCDASTAAPVLNVADFTCFLQKFAGGCN